MTFDTSKDHYGVIIVGAGVSGMAASIQLGRKLGYKDVLIVEKGTDIGGTWRDNVYPGAGNDIPVSMYSFSFAQSADFSSQWASSGEIMSYLHRVQKQFNVNNIQYSTMVNLATWSSSTGLWTLSLTDFKTGLTASKTCNVFISATGALSVPSYPQFEGQDKFEGKVWHSAEWGKGGDGKTGGEEYKNLNVVIVGNGCSAAQIVPSIIGTAKTVTQIARTRQAVLRRPRFPEHPIWSWALKHIPGLLRLQRVLIFFILEGGFITSDVVRGLKSRQSTLADTKLYIKEAAPEKYWDVLEPDFDIAAKRRIYDSGYLASLHSPNFELIQGAIAKFNPKSVVTNEGKEVAADLVVLCTGFKSQEFLFPLKVINDQGESLQEVFKKTNVANFHGTCVSGFPNFFTLMGPNTTTGHSSVIFTSECQVDMIISLISPILKSLSSPKIPAPSVVVKAETQRTYMVKLRAEMKKKVWETNRGLSWYVDKSSGLCTTLYPWNQVTFYRNTRAPREVDFFRR